MMDVVCRLYYLIICVLHILLPFSVVGARHVLKAKKTTESVHFICPLTCEYDIILLERITENVSQEMQLHKINEERR